jgi:hypothetical protein
MKELGCIFSDDLSRLEGADPAHAGTAHKP